MHFQFADGFKNTPLHSKLQEFDNFLQRLSELNKDEFSKDIYTNSSFMAISYQDNLFKYDISHKVPFEIQKQIEDKLWKIFTPQK